jgi:cystathionine beta-lyase/cystathionine gamma-synthase
LAPFEAFLLLRGLKTLAVRLPRQRRGAARVARFLGRHPAVLRVHHPGASDEGEGRPPRGRRAPPGGTAGLVSFTARSPAAARRFLARLQLFSVYVSFGSIASTACLPCAMSHASLPEETRAQRGLAEDLVRLSIGIEEIGDLVDDLARALG